MPITFILHGGETSRADPSNESFFRYFTTAAAKPVVAILMCYFSKPEETWLERLEADRQRVAKQATKEFRLTLATSPEHLLEELPKHDVLYVAGGDAELIEPLVPRLQALPDKLDGKAYLGCSMGAFIVSSQYVLSFDKQESPSVHQGLGLLPFSTLCHWDIEPQKEQKVRLLLEAAPRAPILALEECKYSIFIA